MNLKFLKRAGVAAFTAAISASTSAMAQDAVPTIDKGDTAWMLVSTALVLMMTIPGLALFYGGLVKKENVLATLMQSFSICCLVTVLWMIFGYSLAFTEGSAFIGGFDKVFLKGIGVSSMSGTIPETVFLMFQLTFAIITCALILGAVADRIKFSSMLVFIALWFTFVYLPVAHWVWGPAGLLGGAGVSDFKGLLGYGAMLDYAGGTVVHINCGIAGLMAAIVLGKRAGYGNAQFPPHNLVYSIMGASLLWVGWFGFNAGSALGANDRAGMAMLATQFATAAAAMSWMLIEWVSRGKPSALGTISGAVAGLVAITPASGFVAPSGALVIGIISGVLCYWSVTSLKARFKYDDSLDVFGIHGVAGLAGAILTGVFATKDVGGVSGLIEGNSDQLMAQIIGSVVTLAYAGIVSYVILKVVQMTMTLRVDEEAERTGLDLSLHGEKVHH